MQKRCALFKCFSCSKHSAQALWSFNSCIGYIVLNGKASVRVPLRLGCNLKILDHLYPITARRIKPCFADPDSQPKGVTAAALLGMQSLCASAGFVLYCNTCHPYPAALPRLKLAAQRRDRRNWLMPIFLTLRCWRFGWRSTSAT